jgi:hypothetical protein
VSPSKSHELFDEFSIGLPWTVMGAAGQLVKPPVSILLEALDPLIGGLSGDAEPFRQFTDAVVVQLIVLREISAVVQPR